MKLIPLTIFLLSLFTSVALAQDIKVCIKGLCLQAQVVDTDASRAKGLGFRESLGQKEGMLFILGPGEHKFWMKNMRFPLDLIWIDGEKKIIDIKENLIPCNSDSCPLFGPDQGQAEYVLEVNSGFVRENNIKIGDTINF
jgi:uncharacterized membrane protein (UPF0127 family)